jgi:GWxTD domain-containing protein
VTTRLCRGAGLAAALLAAACAGAAPPAPEQLSNVRLGPEYSQWLIGPIVRMSTREEVQQYLTLTDDASAAAFTEAFWARRGELARHVFERRADEADHRFAEAGYAGRRTDRGTIYVLHGEPKETKFVPPDFVGEPPIEVWRYETSEPGLNGKPPSGIYSFAKYDDLTVFYKHRVRRTDEIDPIR